MNLAQSYVPSTMYGVGGITAEENCLIGARDAFGSLLCTNFWFGVVVFIIALLGSVILLVLLLRWAKKRNNKK